MHTEKWAVALDHILLADGEYVAMTWDRASALNAGHAHGTTFHIQKLKLDGGANADLGVWVPDGDPEFVIVK